MLIKCQDLNFKLPAQFPAFYILIGHEIFLINQLANKIKTAWRHHHGQDSDEKILDIDTPNQWIALMDETHHYSLFAPTLLLDVRYDKKTLDAEGKQFFEKYLQNRSDHCLLMIRAPQFTQKQLQSILQHPQALIIQTAYPGKTAILHWIKDQFQKQAFHFDPAIPAMIELYTRGNLLACSQLVEKIILVHNPEESLSQECVKQHLFDQSEYQLYELSDACLLGDTAQALVILRHALENRTELTLILWVLTQEIRYLLQILTLTKQGKAFQAILSQLKIWPQRSKLYQMGMNRHTQQGLNALLMICAKLDLLIKTSQDSQIGRHLELLVLALATGKEVPSLA